LGRVVKLKTLRRCLARKVAYVAFSPIGKSTIAFSFVPRELTINVSERCNVDVSSPNDASRHSVAIHKQPKVSGLRKDRLDPSLEVAEQRCRRTFGTTLDENG
jgi:hypothetical protein